MNDKTSLCPYRKLHFTCYEDFRLSNEETKSFELGWINQTIIKSNSTLAQTFQYQSKNDFDSYTILGHHGNYPGDGYVYEFRGRLSDIQSNLSMLHQLEWIDSRTRAVIIQLSGLQIQSRFEPINIYASLSSILQLICTIIYMIIIIYFMFIEIQSLFKLKWNYFQQFWPVIKLGIIVCSWMGVALFISRYKEYSRISQLFSQTNGYVYINLQYLTYLNNFLTYMFAFCCFFATIKFVRPCRLNSRVCLFLSTLEISAKDLFGFALMFSIVFFAYICLFYLLFSSKLWSTSNLFQTAEMLFEIILMYFDVDQLIDAHAVLGPTAFILFIFVTVFLCLTMFITIINDSFRRARENQEEDNEILGLKNSNRQETYEEYDARMRTQYFDSFALLDNERMNF